MRASQRTKHATHFIRDNRCDEWVGEKFLQWLEGHMEHWNQVCAVIDDARKRGMKNWSARAAVDVVRWQTAGTKNPIRISNSLTPEFGRLWNHLYADDGFRLVTRSLHKVRA